MSDKPKDPAKVETFETRATDFIDSVLEALRNPDPEYLARRAKFVEQKEREDAETLANFHREVAANKAAREAAATLSSATATDTEPPMRLPGTPGSLPELDFVAGMLPCSTLTAARVRVERGNYEGRVVGSTKTGNDDDPNAKVVPLLPEVAEVLRARRKEMVAAQHPGLTEGWVFPTEKGTLYKGQPLRKVLEDALAGCEIERRVTPHGLRHTANNELRRVANGEVVRAIIGLATEAMTHHYSHVGDNEKREAVARVFAIVKGDERVVRGWSTGARRPTTPRTKLKMLEVPPRFELGNGGFADHDHLTTRSRDGAILKLPRFRGHPKTGVSDAEEATPTTAVLA